MKRRIATGIDIGTYQVKVVVVEETKGPNGAALRIIGTGLAESKGLRHGYIVSKEDVTESVRLAKAQAESVARVPIRSAFLAIGGISLDETRATGDAVISRADQEITELDLEKAKQLARESARPALLNRRVLHEIPLQYRVDGARVLGDPLDMKGTRLEADFLFVTCLAPHAEGLIQAVEDADIEVVDQMASPLAGSYVTLTRDQKIRGCILTNVGAETVSLVVYDEGVPVSVKVFPVGSMNITEDIALGLKISLEDAERLKLGRLGGAMYPRKKVDDLVSARFHTMFGLVEKHLKTIGQRGPLPAGVILTGGGAGSGSITDIAKKSLSLPSKIAELRLPIESKIRDATWAVAYGLALWGLTGDDTPKKGRGPELGGSLKRFLSQFLP